MLLFRRGSQRLLSESRSFIIIFSFGALYLALITENPFFFQKNKRLQRIAEIAPNYFNALKSLNILMYRSIPSSISFRYKFIG
jgi:hypothetical protein